MKNCAKLIAAATLLSVTAASHAANWDTKSIGGFSSVHTYIPSTNSPIGSGHALLVVLHGCAQGNDPYKTAGLQQAAENWGMVIAAPMVVKGAGIANCWEYWTPSDTAHNRTSNDHKRVLDMVAAMKANSTYNIDPSQVYIAGLSSGAGFAHVTACIAPDIFAGFGSFAGPSPGTSSNGAISTFESRDVASICEQYSASFKNSFFTQIASLGQGEGTSTYLTTDGLVSKQYLDQNANGMATLYGVTQQKGQETTSSVFGGSIKQTLWANGRVSRVSVPGLGHAWPGGDSASGSYIDKAGGFNYGDYLGWFFSTNNMRASGSEPNIGGGSASTGGNTESSATAPVITDTNAVIDSTLLTATISGTITVAENHSISSITVSVGGSVLSTDNQQNFSVVTNVAAGQTYTATITATATKAGGQTATTSAYVNFSVPADSAEPTNTSNIPSWCALLPDPSIIAACAPQSAEPPAIPSLEPPLVLEPEPEPTDTTSPPVSQPVQDTEDSGTANLQPVSEGSGSSGGGGSMGLLFLGFVTLLVRIKNRQR